MRIRTHALEHVISTQFYFFYKEDFVVSGRINLFETSECVVLFYNTDKQILIYPRRCFDVTFWTPHEH